MAQTTSWKYCETTTTSHPQLVQHIDCLVSLNDLCKKEGAQNAPFDSELCWSLDKVEEKIAKSIGRQRNATMDLSIAVKSGRNLRAVLCELRLNYKNPLNITKAELMAKKDGSKAIMKHEPQFLEVFYCIFPTNKKEQATSRIRREFANKANVVRVLDLKEFHAEFFG